MFLQRLIIILTCLLLANCSEPPPDEEALRANIKQIESALETGHTAKILVLLHDDFQTQKGQNREWVKSMLKLYSVQQINIHAVISNLKVDLVDEQVARVNFNSLLTGGRNLLPDRGQLYQVETNWRKESDDWLLIYLKAEPLR